MVDGVFQSPVVATEPISEIIFDFEFESDFEPLLNCATAKGKASQDLSNSFWRFVTTCIRGDNGSGGGRDVVVSWWGGVLVLVFLTI
jgi:hypothetical protein